MLSSRTISVNKKKLLFLQLTFDCKQTSVYLSVDNLNSVSILLCQPGCGEITYQFYTHMLPTSMSHPACVCQLTGSL